MGWVTEEIRLHAPPDTVWGFITDPARFPDYVDGYERGRVTSDAATGLGSSFEWWARLGPLLLHSTEKVTEWQEGSRVRYQGQLAGVGFRSAMWVQPAPGGGALLEVSVHYDVPWYLGGPVSDRWVARELIRGHVRRSLLQLARRFGV